MLSLFDFTCTLTQTVTGVHFCGADFLYCIYSKTFLSSDYGRMTPLSSTRKREQKQPTLDDKILNVTGITCHILGVGVSFLLAQTYT